MNTTHDASRDLRRTRLILLSTLFLVGLTGCSLVLLWLIRYSRGNMRSTRICSLILNLIIANLSVYIFATGIQIYWEFQANRQWPFNAPLCRIVKFFQSFSILSSTYIIVVMAIDRCIAIVTPLRVGKIRVRYLCGCAWFLAGLLSTPNIFIFHLYINGSIRSCTPIFTRHSSVTGRRIYLTFISLVVYFIPFCVLVFCYTLIFIKLLFRERDQRDRLVNQTPSTSDCCSRFCNKKIMQLSSVMHQKTDRNLSSHCSTISDNGILRKQVNTYAKARSKTFRMIIILVLFMVVFGAPYYCLELYIAYTGRKPSDLILALAGGAAVAPSSLDPWIFLLFWVNWNEKKQGKGSRRLITLSLQRHQHNQYIQSRKMNRSKTLGPSSASDSRKRRSPLASNSYLSAPNIVCDSSLKNLDTL